MVPLLSISNLAGQYLETWLFRCFWCVIAGQLTTRDLPIKKIFVLQKTFLKQWLMNFYRAKVICSAVWILDWYIHITSGFKTSGFKTSCFKTSGFKTSGLQNVRFTKRQVSKCPVSKPETSGFKTSIEIKAFKFYILIKQK
jgi:hypothetical protein